MLADGVGDASQAREASAKIVETITRNFKSRPRSWSIQKALEEFTRLLNRSLYQESMARYQSQEMLSTLCAVALTGRTLHGLNVGDSRVYLLRDKQLTQLSHDHTADAPAMQHVLSQAMGMGLDVAPHCFERTVELGDVILLCSDGVTRVLGDEELKSLLQHHASARTIVAHAHENATEETLDDISAIVIDVQETGPETIAQQQKLAIPESLQPGGNIDGYTLARSFKNNERIWIADKDGEKVVLKFAPREAADNETILNQFIQEMWMVTRLKADYFTRAFVPDHPTSLYYVMEYVEAPTLREFIDSAAMKVDEAIGLAKFLLNACQFLLGFDLVHGDIKPENILVLKRESEITFKLIDFGSISEIFSVTSRAGTPSYLAPERFKAAPISEGTEIFAIGVTLYQALTRVYPFGEIEPFQNPSFNSARPPGKVNPNIPPWLESAILRAISPDTETRHHNFSEMKYDLEHPDQVRPFFQKNAPLLERYPVLFYKAGFFLMLLLNLYLLLRLFGK